MTKFTYSDELFSDIHKDSYGFRPSADTCAAWDKMSPAEKQKSWDYMVDSVEEGARRDRERQEFAVAAYEKRVADMAAEFGIDRFTAMRWDMDANFHDPDVLEDEQAWDHYFYKLGLAAHNFDDVHRLRNEYFRSQHLI